VNNRQRSTLHRIWIGLLVYCLLAPAGAALHPGQVARAQDAHTTVQSLRPTGQANPSNDQIEIADRSEFTQRTAGAHDEARAAGDPQDRLSHLPLSLRDLGRRSAQQHQAILLRPPLESLRVDLLHWLRRLTGLLPATSDGDIAPMVETAKTQRRAQ
jgi:hypothetical protein